MTDLSTFTKRQLARATLKIAVKRQKSAERCLFEYLVGNTGSFARLEVAFMSDSTSSEITRKSGGSEGGRKALRLTSESTWKRWVGSTGSELGEHWLHSCRPDIQRFSRRQILG